MADTSFRSSGRLRYERSRREGTGHLSPCALCVDLPLVYIPLKRMAANHYFPWLSFCPFSTFTCLYFTLQLAISQALSLLHTALCASLSFNIRSKPLVVNVRQFQNESGQQWWSSLLNSRCIDYSFHHPFCFSIFIALLHITWITVLKHLAPVQCLRASVWFVNCTLILIWWLEVCAHFNLCVCGLSLPTLSAAFIWFGNF